MGQLTERQRPLRRGEYERMVDLGFFHDERLELIRGLVIEKDRQTVQHADVTQALGEVLVLRLLRRAGVRCQLPFAAGDDSLPEPDLAIVAPARHKYAHPAEAFLIIEVADSSLKLDRQEKAEVYARACVPEYWVVNLGDQIIERHSEPVGATFGRVTPFRRGDAIQLLAFPDVTVRVDDVFGDE